MKQREVQDAENVRWVCVQALGGLDDAIAEHAADRLESDAGTVPVVCTPSGGAQSARIELERGWEDDLSDEDLLEALARASDRMPHG